MSSFIETLFPRDDDTPACQSGNDYDGALMGARISAVFVVLVASGFGSFFPILSSRYSFIRLPWWCFFIAKYFGSGVIVATAFIHLLQPANEALSDPCLGGVFESYPMAFAICLIMLFVLFFFELVAFHFVDEKLASLSSEEGGAHTHSHFGDETMYTTKKEEDDEESAPVNSENKSENKYPSHFAHAHDHQDPEVIGTPAEDQDKESYYGQLLAVFVLEFGVVFHSVFVGLSLAIAGEEFKTLYVVIVFHQLFEGLGLGTRIAQTPWPKEKRLTPWLMALAYTFTTPVSIAIGLGVRTSYAENSRNALITNGVFDSMSAGILFYAGIVELMAHEFLYSGAFKGKGGFKKMMIAYVIMCFGAGLMALLGKWA